MADYTAIANDFYAGRVVSRSFSTFFRNILPFGLLALVLTSPTYVYAILTGAGDITGTADPFESRGDSFAEPIILFIVELLLSYVVTAALVYGTIQHLRNNTVSVGDCFSKGLALMFPVLGVAIVTSIITMIAFMALFIPGLIVMTMLWVTIPVAVIEQRGLGSLARSAELTKGYRWRVFFVFLLMVVIFFGFSIVLGGATAVFTLGSLANGGEMSTAAFTGVIAMQWITSAVLGALMAVIAAVSYHDLRVAKEGVDTGQIASVFD